MKDFSDEFLMNKFRDSLDEVSFELLSERYYNYALTIAYKYFQDEGLARDCVQESLLKVIKFRKKFSDNYSFKSWFSTIVRNTSIDLVRKWNKHYSMIDDLAYAAADGAIPGGDRFGDLVASLQEQDRKIMTYRFVDGLTFEQISNKLGGTVEALKKRSQRALKKLKGSLSTVVFF